MTRVVGSACGRACREAAGGLVGPAEDAESQDVHDDRDAPDGRDGGDLGAVGLQPRDEVHGDVEVEVAEQEDQPDAAGMEV